MDDDPTWNDGAELLEAAHGALIGVEIPWIDTVARMLGGHAAAAVRRIGVVRVLIGAGAHQEAAIIARSVLELGFSAAYVFSCGEAEQRQRASRFDDMEAVQLYAFIEKVYPDLSPSDQTVGFNTLRQHREEALRLHTKIEKSIKTNWTGEQGWKGVIARIDQQDVREHMLWLHDKPYFQLSMYAHPTPTAIRHTIGLPPLPANLAKVVSLAAIIPSIHMIKIACEYAHVALPAEPVNVNETRCCGLY